MGPILLELIDIVLSTNVSRSYHLQICTEYFIDERYFYLLLFHVNATLTIGSIALLATGSLLFVYVQHACGMFKIASYRIKKAIHICTLKDLNTQKEILIYKDLIRVVDIHRKSMTFSNYLVSRFQISYMFLIVFGVLSISINIFRIFQIVLLEYNTGELLLCFAITSSCFVYMFICNLIGQQIIDHNNDIFLTAYKVQWYVTPLFIQRLILILLQRGSKSFHLKVGGLFVASLECFATVHKIYIYFISFTIVLKIYFLYNGIK
ncbi:OR9A protein, partial [Acromyrmex heyeri]